MTPVIVVPPSHGELADCAQNGGAFRCRYTPEPGFVGRDAFKWQAAIGPYVSAIGTYTIDVIPYPPPSASSGVAVMVGDRTNELRLFHSYTPATVTFEIVSSPSHGLLAGCEWVATSSAVVCEYTPEPGFRGDDSLTWRWTDGEMWSDPGQITLRGHR